MKHRRLLERGFTLVEMLVAVSIFSLAMSAMVVSLKVSIDAWRKTKLVQTRESELERAISTMTEDVRQAYHADGRISALEEHIDTNGGESLALTTRLSSKSGHPVPLGVWAEVSYSIKELEKTRVLVRSVTPHISSAPETDAFFEEELIHGAREMRLSFFTPQGEQLTLQQTSNWPFAVKVLLDRDEAVPCQFTINLPQSNGQ